MAQTELSYGYTQPAVEGEFYNLYHGFMEARPLTDSTSKMLYTLTLDVSNLADRRQRTLTLNDARNVHQCVARHKGTGRGRLASPGQRMYCWICSGPLALHCQPFRWAH